MLHLVGLEERNLGRCPAKIQRPHCHVGVHVYGTCPLAEAEQISTKKVDRCPPVNALLCRVGGETDGGGGKTQKNTKRGFRNTSYVLTV